jgi:transporter family-2 protein
VPLLYAIIAFLAGAGLVIQTGVNASLRGRLGHPLLSATANFLTGVVALFAITVLTRVPAPARETLAGTPPWMWCGGLLGASFVLASIVAAPRLGAGAFVGILVAGQMATSVIVDHNGWLGFPIHHVTPLRVLGAALIVGGVVLVRAF